VTIEEFFGETGGCIALPFSLLPFAANIRKIPPARILFHASLSVILLFED
jgi:hypothetical protein